MEMYHLVQKTTCCNDLSANKLTSLVEITTLQRLKREFERKGSPWAVGTLKLPFWGPGDLSCSLNDVPQTHVQLIHFYSTKCQLRSYKLHQIFHTSSSHCLSIVEWLLITLRISIAWSHLEFLPNYLSQALECQCGKHGVFLWIRAPCGRYKDLSS